MAKEKFPERAESDRGVKIKWDVDTWEELYKVLDRTKDEELKAIIAAVRRGDREITAVTRTDGIRNKVLTLLETVDHMNPHEILERAYRKSIAEAKSFQALFLFLDSIDGLSDSRGHFIPSPELKSQINFARATGSTIFNAAGLDDKVRELIKKEKQK